MHFYKSSKPRKRRETSWFSRKTKIILLCLLTILLLLICLYLTLDKATAFFIWIIWVFTPLFLYFFTKKFLEFPYRIFLGFNIEIHDNLDLFTNTKELNVTPKKNEIQINLYRLSNNNIKNKQNFQKIEKMYLRLIMFWYAQKYHRSKLRASFPLLALVLSIIYFFILLWIINDIDTSKNILEFVYLSKYFPQFTSFLTSLNVIDISDNIRKLALMTTSLAILYFTMIIHINNFLDSKYYIERILQSFDKIHFKDLKYSHKIKLFFDKNFLVFIHDSGHHRDICLSNEKSFNKFILNGKFDIKGRNLIIAVFISLFFILFIETSVNILVDSKTDEITNQIFQKDANQTKPIKIKIIENGN